VPNVKWYFVWSSGYLLWVWWLTKSWQKTVVYAFWPLSFYYVGQLYVFRIIQPEDLNHPLYPDGRSLFFKFTPFLVLGMTMIVSWIIRVLTTKFRLKSWTVINILLIIVLIQVLSLINGDLAMPGVVYLANIASQLSVVVWLWWTIDYLGQSENAEKGRFWTYLLALIKSFLVIESGVVVAQGIRGGTLGLVVEQSSILPYYGAGSDESALLIRPIGLHGHANMASYYLLMGLEAWILVWLGRKKEDEEIWSQSWILLVIVALLWLQSRTIFVAGFIWLCGWGYLYTDQIKERVGKIYFKGWRLWGAVLLILFSGIILTNRFWGTISSRGLNSGWETRIRSVEVATRVIERHGWLGVGIGNYIPMAYREDIGSAMRQFPEAVHNGWLLITAEQGLIGLGLWLGFIWMVVKQTLRLVTDNKIRWLVIGGLITQSVVFMFQPITDILSINVLLGVILLATKYEKGKD